MVQVSSFEPNIPPQTFKNTPPPPPPDFETDIQHNLKKKTLNFLLQAQTLQFCIRIHTIELCFTGITAQLPGSVNVSTSAAKICKCAKVC